MEGDNLDFLFNSDGSTNYDRFNSNINGLKRFLRKIGQWVLISGTIFGTTAGLNFLLQNVAGFVLGGAILQTSLWLGVGALAAGLVSTIGSSIRSRIKARREVIRSEEKTVAAKIVTECVHFEKKDKNFRYNRNRLYSYLKRYGKDACSKDVMQKIFDSENTDKYLDIMLKAAKKGHLGRDIKNHVKSREFKKRTGWGWKRIEGNNKADEFYSAFNLKKPNSIDIDKSVETESDIHYESSPVIATENTDRHECRYTNTTENEHFKTLKKDIAEIKNMLNDTRVVKTEKQKTTVATTDKTVTPRLIKKIIQENLPKHKGRISDNYIDVLRACANAATFQKMSLKQYLGELDPSDRRVEICEKVLEAGIDAIPDSYKKPKSIEDAGELYLASTVYVK